MPWGKLIIYEDPIWNPFSKTWVYVYEYDWSSEGSAIEKNLELYVKINSNVSTFQGRFSSSKQDFKEFLLFLINLENNFNM